MRKLLFVMLMCIATATHSKQSEVLCLAQNLYHEARGEPPLGRLLVAKVTINRQKSGKFPKTICGVVYQKGQFSWTKHPNKIKDQQAWKESLELAHIILHTNVLDYVPYHHIMYYHSQQVSPAWPFKKVIQIGNHIFYV